ncbi:MAG: hypothetical protein COB37_05650 [Kordiimonadales bacterium]|nr:MAG: hypothetical protein COB37_05650 [Kordiimonadales bacterium]
MLVEFPKYEKPAGERCKHQLEGGGCGFYKKRPEDCSYFQCIWLTLEQMPNYTRPDICGVMFRYDLDDETWNPFAKSCVVAVPSASQDALFSDAAKACYRMFWGGGKAVWVQIEGRRRFLIDENGTEILADRIAEYEGKLR